MTRPVGHSLDANIAVGLGSAKLLFRVVGPLFTIIGRSAGPEIATRPGWFSSASLSLASQPTSLTAHNSLQVDRAECQSSPPLLDDHDIPHN